MRCDGWRPMQADMAVRMREWLVKVFKGDEAVDPERTLPTLVLAFAGAVDLQFSDLQYWTALVSTMLGPRV